MAARPLRFFLSPILRSPRRSYACPPRGSATCEPSVARRQKSTFIRHRFWRHLSSSEIPDRPRGDFRASAVRHASIAPTAASSQQPPTGDFWQGRQLVHSFTKSHKATSTGKVLLFPPVITLSPGYHADLTFISPFWRFYGSPLSSRLCQNYAPPGQTCSGEPPPGDCPASFAPRTTGQE